MRWQIAQGGAVLQRVNAKHEGWIRDLCDQGMTLIGVWAERGGLLICLAVKGSTRAR